MHASVQAAPVSEADTNNSSMRQRVLRSWIQAHICRQARLSNHKFSVKIRTAKLANRHVRVAERQSRSCAALWNEAGPSGMPSSCSSEVPPNSPPFDSRPVPGNADHASNTGCRRPIPRQIPPAPPRGHAGMLMRIFGPLISAGTRCRPWLCSRNSHVRVGGVSAPAAALC